LGALLGTGQAMVLRGQVRHPWRWVGATMAGWAPAMVVILLGASLPGADWPAPAVVALAAFTALIAGTILGLVSGWFLPTLDGPSAHNRIVLLLLGTRAHALLDRPLIALRIRGVPSGRTFELPVQYAADENAVVILPGRPETKRWWRNLVEPAPVEVLLGGRWQHGYGMLLQPAQRLRRRVGCLPATVAARGDTTGQCTGSGPVHRVAHPGCSSNSTDSPCRSVRH
jgi:hypothetical protein